MNPAIRLTIRRYKPGQIDPPRYQDYVVAIDGTDPPPRTVLDALELIRTTQDDSLMYRHSCHHSSCGTCACTINGRPRLTCTAELAVFEDGRITLEPLAGFDCLGDLVVDMGGFFSALDPKWSGLQIDGKAPGTRDDATTAPQRLENCIECGCCVAACPAAQDQSSFLGPAVLAALHRQGLKYPEQEAELLAVAAGDRGERHCRRALACSRVCPTQVYPAHHIFELRRLVGAPDR
jgi:succinate dehydrogenase / fumarate reductase iron-sulfur subunit